jgi:hypothetical protein
LDRFYGRDDISFTFISDEFNGITRGTDGQVRPIIARSYQSFSQAMLENGQSRSAIRARPALSFSFYICSRTDSAMLERAQNERRRHWSRSTP